MLACLATIAARLGLELFVITKLNEGVLVAARNKYNITAVTAVTAIRTALIDVLLMPETCTAVAAVTSLGRYCHVVDKLHYLVVYQSSWHICINYVLAIYIDDVTVTSTVKAVHRRDPAACSHLVKAPEPIHVAVYNLRAIGRYLFDVSDMIPA
jgi:hypothetical protein